MERKDSEMAEKIIYEYEEIPKNIKLFGEVSGEHAVYFEDYVMSFLKQVFQEKKDIVVILVGKKGKNQASGHAFVYGAFDVPLKMKEGEALFEPGDWDDIYRTLHQKFSGAVLLGFSYAASSWNSKEDSLIRKMQEKYFSETGQIVFLVDLASKEEKLFTGLENGLREEKGYYVYYAKNPMMQDFALCQGQKKSFEADYVDTVTTNMRKLIAEKEEEKHGKSRYLAYGVVYVGLLALLFGGNMWMSQLHKKPDVRGVMEQKRPVSTKKQMPSASPAKKKIYQKEKGKKTVSENKAKPENNIGNSNLKKKTPSRKHSRKITRTMEKKNQCYVVKSGDTLSQIVWRQYHSFRYLAEIRRINHISDKNLIQDGQCILLPPHKFG